MSAILLFQEVSIGIWGLSVTVITMILTASFGLNKIIVSNKHATYKKIEKVETTMTEKIEKVETTMTEKIDKVETTITEKIDKVDNKKVSVILFEKTVSAIEDKIKVSDDNANRRFDGIEKKIDQLIELHLKK